MADEYFILKPGQKSPQGPFSADAVISMVKAGVIDCTYLYAQEGMATWLPLSGFPGMVMVQRPDARPRPTNHLIHAVLVTFCCCMPLGVVALYYAAQVNPLYDNGNFEGAQEAADAAARWCLFSLIVGILFIIGGLS